MRKKSGGVRHVAEVIADDLEERATGLSKPQRYGLADLAASVLACRSVNTSELANVLPRKVKSSEECYRFINRWLSNSKIKPIRVMHGFIPEIVSAITSNGEFAILAMDQSIMGNGFECLMISLRFGQRALPLAWRVEKTKGEIGYAQQERLLKAACELIPKNIKVILMADRFYGTAALVTLCKQFGWGYRIRLRKNLNFFHRNEGIITPEEAHKLNLNSLKNVYFGERGPLTNIGIIQEKGHPEPWFIAMDVNPNVGRTLDYGMRWGIEALFSDLKTRGFHVTKTQLRHADRIERLLLVLTIALFWAVSTGMQPRTNIPKSKKKRIDL